MHDKHSLKKKKVTRKKQRKVRVIAMVMAPTVLISSYLAALKIKDGKEDHLHEACTFSKVCTELNLDIGWRHLIKEIEKSSDYTAYHQLEKTTIYYRHSTEWTLKDGYYSEQEKIIPPGYQELNKPHHGYDCYREEYEPEAVVIQDQNKKLVRKLLLK